MTASTTPSINIRISELEIDDNWPCSNDLLERHKEIENLTPVLLNAQAPLVFSIDAPWGGGKTSFIQLWEHYLKKTKHEFIYLNAWQTDFSDDPLLPMLSAIDDWLSASTQNEATTLAWQKAKTLATSLFKSSVIAATKAATFGGLDLDKEYEKLASELSAGAVEDIVDSFAVKTGALERFKQNLSIVVANLPDHQNNLIVFIDELDRCRPNYSIELLERIKHLFDIPGVVFVLAINSEQLGNSVKGIYGADFDGVSYLKRFIDLDYTLAKPDLINYVGAHLNDSEITERYSKMQDGQYIYPRVIDIFTWLSARFSLSYRDIFVTIQRFKLILRSIPADHYDDSEVLCVLLILRKVNKALYYEFIEKPQSVNKLISYLLGGNIPGVEIPEPFSITAGLLIKSTKSANRFSEVLSHWKELLAKNEAYSDVYRPISHLIQVAESQDRGMGRSTIREIAFSRIELLNRINL